MSDSLPPDELTSTLRISAREGSRSTLVVWLVAAVLILTVAGLALGALTLWPRGPANPVEDLQGTAEAGVKFGADAESAAHRVAWNQLHDRLAAADRDHADLAAILPQLVARLEALQQDEPGRRIAARDEWVDEYLVLAERKRPSAADVSSAKRDLDALKPLAERAIATSIVLPCNPVLQHQATELAVRLAAALEETRADGASLETLLRLSRLAEPSAASLATTVASRKAAREEELLHKLGTARRRDEDAAEERRLRAEEAQRQEQERIAMAAEQKRQTELKQQRDEAEAAAKAAEEKRVRVAKFAREYPQLESLLIPFTSQGRRQFTPERHWVDAEPTPLSLSAMKACGMLRNDDTSWYLVGDMGRNSPNGNDRPQGTFPQKNYEAGPELQRVQRFLRDYGDIMVEKGLLAP